MMSQQLFWLSVALICGGIQMSSAQAECQKCMASNDAYCVDDKSYYLCVDGKNPSTTELHQCDKGQVCTSSDNICEPINGPNNVKNNPVCSGSCGQCPAATAANTRYTCVSRTQFGRCANGKVTIVSTCEAGSICSSELYAQTGVICAPQCVTDFYKVSATCSNDVVTTTTTIPPPVDIDDIKTQCRNAANNRPNEKYFYIGNINDDECKTYIFCEKFGDDMDALLVKCATGYFDSSTSKCVPVKPADCNMEAGSGFGSFF